VEGREGGVRVSKLIEESSREREMGWFGKFSPYLIFFALALSLFLAVFFALNFIVLRWYTFEGKEFTTVSHKAEYL
jgi:hypothetical protein